jgi:hypothetical protein
MSRWYDVIDGENGWWWHVPEWVEFDPDAPDNKRTNWMPEASDNLQMCLFKATRFVSGGG